MKGVWHDDICKLGGMDPRQGQHSGALYFDIQHKVRILNTKPMDRKQCKSSSNGTEHHFSQAVPAFGAVVGVNLTSCRHAHASQRLPLQGLGLETNFQQLLLRLLLI